MVSRLDPAKMLPAMIRTVSVFVVALLCVLWGDAARAQMSEADLVTRIDRLEGAIRDLTGQVEQLQYRNQQLGQQLQQLQQQMQGGAALPQGSASPQRPPVAPYTPPTAQYSPPPPPPPNPQYQPPATVGAPSGAAIANGPPGSIEQDQPPPGPGRRGDAFNPAANPTAPGAPRPLGTSTVANEPPPIADMPATAPGPRQPGAPLDLSIVSTPQGGGAPPPSGAQQGNDLPPPPPSNPNATGTGALAALPPSNSPKDEYDLGYGYIQRKDYANAADTFADFLHKYPSDRLAPEAQFWRGEALFQTQRYHDAAEAFLAVSTKYENTARAPDALLRLGMSLAALGEKEAACASLGEVLRKYPRASLSVKQGVDREQKRAHC
jgi:tol-pal system protein YbgF